MSSRVHPAPERGDDAARKHRAAEAGRCVRCLSRVPWAIRPTLLLLTAVVLGAADLFGEPWWPPWSEDVVIPPTEPICVDPADGLPAHEDTEAACAAAGACSAAGFATPSACRLGACVY